MVTICYNVIYLLGRGTFDLLLARVNLNAGEEHFSSMRDEDLSLEVP